MATESNLGRFATQALCIEKTLNERGIPGSAGRVVHILDQARGDLGVSQREVILASALPKDVVSKLITGLVRVGLLEHHREHSGSKAKRVVTTEQGHLLLSELEAELKSLQSPTPSKENQQPTAGKVRRPTFFDNWPEDKG